MMKAQKISSFRLCALLLLSLAVNACQQNKMSFGTAANDQASLATTPLYAVANETVAKSKSVSNERTITDVLADCKRQMDDFELWMSRCMMQPHQ